MVIMMYDYQGVIPAERVPVGTSVTAHYYSKFLHKKLRSKIRQNLSQLMEYRYGVLLVHNNARPHITESVRTTWTNYK